MYKRQIQSWPSGEGRLFVYRDYLVRNDQGKELVRGSSSWVMIDIEKRKPVSVANNFPLKASDDLPRMPLEKHKINLLTQSTTQRTKVGFSDIDVNQHTNNVKYVEWALENYYQSIGKIRKPTRIDFVFKAESRLDDELTFVQEVSAENEVVIAIQNETKNHLSFQLKMKFT